MSQRETFSEQSTLSKDSVHEPVPAEDLRSHSSRPADGLKAVIQHVSRSRVICDDDLSVAAQRRLGMGSIERGYEHGGLGEPGIDDDAAGWVHEDHDILGIEKSEVEFDFDMPIFSSQLVPFHWQIIKADCSQAGIDAERLGRRNVDRVALGRSEAGAGVEEELFFCRGCLLVHMHRHCEVGICFRCGIHGHE